MTSPTIPGAIVLTLLMCLVAHGGLVHAQSTGTARNPIIWADVPDPSVIRVGDVYYMTSTTMHMSPGVPIMKSMNLVDWHLVGYVYNELANADALFMRQGQQAYGRGSWASSLRHHQETFYVATFSYTTGESYVFTSPDIERGPWTKTSLGTLLHDQSLFFDDDGRVYLVYGAGDIRIVELTADALQLKPGGVRRLLIADSGSIAGERFYVPGEGAHLEKLNGTYYLFLIAWPAGGMRSQLVYRASKLEGPWEGRVVLQDEGIAQGGIVDTPEGAWYGLLFGDRGAVGRIPYLVPVSWRDGWPEFGVAGKVPSELDMESDGTGVAGIVSSDEFEQGRLVPEWQWNHQPDSSGWSLTERPGWLRLRTGRPVERWTHAINTPTQRTFGPQGSATTLLDVAGLKDGDRAGLGLLIEDYAWIGVRRNEDSLRVVMTAMVGGVEEELAVAELNGNLVHLRIETDFRNQTDLAVFSYSHNGQVWRQLGPPFQLRYTLGHFMGARFGLMSFARVASGGHADFEYVRFSGQ